MSASTFPVLSLRRIVTSTFLLKLPFARSGRMHQRIRRNAGAGQNAIHEIHPEFFHRVGMKIRVLHQPDLLVEAVQLVKALATRDRGAAPKQGVAEQHGGDKPASRVELLADERPSRSLRRVASLPFQLLDLNVAEGLDPAGNKARTRPT